MGLFSGMDKFGLQDIKQDEIYADPNKKKAEAASDEGVKKPASETDYLIDRTYTCPVCDAEFKSRTVKSHSVRQIGTDEDLRPKYQQLDSLKYEVIVCPHCGYGAHTRTFKNIYDSQKKMVRETITPGFHYSEPAGAYTYDDAIERYQIAFANAMAIKQIDSEKAYLCLRMGWTIRGKMESLNPQDPGYAEDVKQCREDENEALKLALDGFIAARTKEQPPFAGMDQSILDFMISVLAIRFGRTDVASKLISSLISSMTTNPRIKERARELKDKLVAANK